MSTYSEQREHAFTTSWLVQLGVRVREDIKRESERKETSGLDEGETDNEARLAFGYRPDKDRRNGRGWGRRKTDLLGPAQVSFLNRVQESGEVQGRILGSGSSSYTFEHGALTRDKDESS